MSHRPGPRSDLDVREQIVESAEELFGRDGVDTVSLRAVARAAGVSPGALGYHYPTRQDLVAAVVRRRASTLGPEVRDNLAALVASTADVHARDLVSAVLDPVVHLLTASPESGLHWLKVFIHVGLTDDPVWHGEVAAVTDLPQLFVAAAARVLPGRDRELMRTRMSIAVFSMLTTLSGADLRGYRGYDERGVLDPAFVEELTSFTAAGISAA
jgi:AcrR family transcriptional regulator